MNKSVLHLKKFIYLKKLLKKTVMLKQIYNFSSEVFEDFINQIIETIY